MYKAKVIKGKQLGRKLGFPTANLELNEGDLPEYGIYAGYVFFEGEKYKGAIFYGPVDEKVVLEVHILDFDKDVYGQEIEVELTEKIREVRKFNSQEELKKQIATDCLQIRELLK